jgi:fructuronate reductase
MRLSRATLSALPPTVRRPDVDPATLRTGIVHLGIGAFARAHLAAYTQPLLRDAPSWGICGVSLRSPDTHDALTPQDNLYTRAERDGSGERLHIMTALTELLVGADAAMNRLLDPAVRIVTITVTEKGYHGPLPSLMAIALQRRRAANVAPFTVLSCDNLPSNGDTTRRFVLQAAEQLDPPLARYIADTVAFPNCMVDRIVPATTPDDRARIDAGLGMHDAWPVVCEPFTQWVIEEWLPLSRRSFMSS